MRGAIHTAMGITSAVTWDKEAGWGRGVLLLLTPAFLSLICCHVFAGPRCRLLLPC